MDLTTIIIKELAEKIQKQFTCFGENTEKYITFAVPIEKEATYTTYYNLLIAQDL